MSTFIDGPAVTVTLDLRRAPILLRVTHGRRGWDALDQREDTPRDGESVYVYILTEEPATVHICSRDKQGRRSGGWRLIGKYRLLTENPPGAEIVRDNLAWAAWCEQNRERLTPKWAQSPPTPSTTSAASSPSIA